MADQTDAGARRSSAWFGADGKVGFVHRSKMYNQGGSNSMFDGRPVIGIANSASDLAPCNAHLGRVADAVKRGVLMAGGLPLEFPTISLGETLMRPSAMLFRNLMAMDVEETLRANPLDGVILLGGCDKTVPAQVMGGLSADLPMIMVTGGPALNGRFRGEAIGSGTHVWKFSEEVRAGRMTECEFRSAEACLSRSAGHCTTMGTASTMACVTEALGLSLPGSATVPAVDAGRNRVAEQAGQRIVTMVEEGLTPSRVLERRSFENAIRVNAAIGGSTNAVVHLLAMGGRTEVALHLDDFDRLAADIPLLVDLMPSGQFLMEELHDAGGLPAIVQELGDLLDLDALTVTGNTLGENCGGAPNWRSDVVRSRERPLAEPGSHTAVLRGNLAPDGAIIKLSAASPELTEHTGPALVFDTIEDYDAQKDSADLPVTPDTVLVVRNAGPIGYPGMPEIGNLAIPKKLLDQGIDDIVRITDGRMSGTSYGTVVLHVAPEAAAGGSLALLRTGDRVTLDVPSRRLNMHVAEDELHARASEPTTADEVTTGRPQPDSGWVALYRNHVTQANRGADLDILTGRRGHAVPRRHL